MLNIIIGGIMIVGGLSGKLALIGTNSPGALVGLGFVLAGWGVYQVRRNKQQQNAPPGGHQE